jgi:hypothetical protein
VIGIFEVQPDRLYPRMSIESGTDRNHRIRARCKAMYTMKPLPLRTNSRRSDFCDSLTGSSRLVKNRTPSNCSNEAALSRDTSSIATPSNWPLGGRDLQARQYVSIDASRYPAKVVRYRRPRIVKG